MCEEQNTSLSSIPEILSLDGSNEFVKCIGNNYGAMKVVPQELRGINAAIFLILQN